MKRFVLALTLTAFSALAQHAEPGAKPEQQHATAEHKEGDHGESAGGHGGSTQMWKWVNFGILAALLAWQIGKHAPPFFTARIAEIQKDINEAKAIRDEANARVAGIEKRLGNLDAELAALCDNAKREMDAESERIQEETKRLVAQAGEQAQQEISSMTKAAEMELRQEASRLALQSAETKLKTRISPDANESLVARFVSGLRATSQN
ncbi:MAG: ATP synthase F0 subunit B [Acidobacteria bacterium]|nr:ATP synthase F0 subunit B [Acidobacteriota bacterium]